MSSKSPKDYEIPDKEAGARMDPQPQKHLGSPNGKTQYPGQKSFWRMSRYPPVKNSQ